MMNLAVLELIDSKIYLQANVFGLILACANLLIQVCDQLWIGLTSPAVNEN